MIGLRSNQETRSCSSSKTMPLSPACFSIRLTRTASKGSSRPARRRPSTSLANTSRRSYTLDIRLSDSNGLILLDRLKHDAETRHIPVHIVSVTDETPYVMQYGVVNWIRKPVKREDLDQAFAGIKEATARKVRHLLAVTGDTAERQYITDLIGNSDVRVEAVASPEEGLELLKTRPCDCLVVDMLCQAPLALASFVPCASVRNSPAFP
jgi:CheY-like chemotaxis protein